MTLRDFPDGPAFKTPNGGGVSLIPGWGTKTSHA